jgi:hypothetical protein
MTPDEIISFFLEGVPEDARDPFERPGWTPQRPPSLLPTHQRLPEDEGRLPRDPFVRPGWTPPTPPSLRLSSPLGEEQMFPPRDVFKPPKNMGPPPIDYAQPPHPYEKAFPRDVFGPPRSVDEKIRALLENNTEPTPIADWRGDPTPYKLDPYGLGSIGGGDGPGAFYNSNVDKARKKKDEWMISIGQKLGELIRTKLLNKPMLTPEEEQKYINPRIGGGGGPGGGLLGKLPPGVLGPGPRKEEWDYNSRNVPQAIDLYKKGLISPESFEYIKDYHGLTPTDYGMEFDDYLRELKQERMQAKYDNDPSIAMEMSEENGPGRGSLVGPIKRDYDVSIPTLEDRIKAFSQLKGAFNAQGRPTTVPPLRPASGPYRKLPQWQYLAAMDGAFPLQPEHELFQRQAGAESKLAKWLEGANIDPALESYYKIAAAIQPTTPGKSEEEALSEMWDTYGDYNKMVKDWLQNKILNRVDVFPAKKPFKYPPDIGIPDARMGSPEIQPFFSYRFDDPFERDLYDQDPNVLMDMVNEGSMKEDPYGNRDWRQLDRESLGVPEMLDKSPRRKPIAGPMDLFEPGANNIHGIQGKRWIRNPVDITERQDREWVEYWIPKWLQRKKNETWRYDETKNPSELGHEGKWKWYPGKTTKGGTKYRGHWRNR